MKFSRDLPSPSSMFSTYASMMGFMMMMKPMVRTIVPLSVQTFLVSYVKSRFASTSSTLTLIINDMNKTDKSGIRRQNDLFYEAQTYLSSKISPDALKLKITRDPSDKKFNLYLSQGEVVSDTYEGVEIKWRFLAGSKRQTTPEDGGEFHEIFDWECLELSFNKQHKDLVLNSYIPYVESKAKEIKEERRILKMHSYSSYFSRWESLNFEHPSTFETMAMNQELKRLVIEDLERFIRRKDYYKRVGKAWKRGYLLYGPPGTGKTSLVAAIANYLKFDIYDLQLASVKGDADLRRLLLATSNSSILLIEDIDCSVDLPTRLQPLTTTHGYGGDSQVSTTTLSLSGLLNCIDGLWSSCGNERIIIFTTNNKDKLDEALLRPGRMDMHIYMGHCGFDGFKTLASNYLGLSSHDNDDDDMTHRLYPEIKGLIDGPVLTPAQVAEELMKNEDVDEALEGLVSVLKRKRSESDSEKCEVESTKKLMTFHVGDEF
ncbi:unnamed protein product [Cochlearia groenlandica]